MGKQYLIFLGMDTWHKHFGLKKNPIPHCKTFGHFAGQLLTKSITGGRIYWNCHNLQISVKSGPHLHENVLQVLVNCNETTLQVIICGIIAMLAVCWLCHEFPTGIALTLYWLNPYQLLANCQQKPRVLTLSLVQNSQIPFYFSGCHVGLGCKVAVLVGVVCRYK